MTIDAEEDMTSAGQSKTDKLKIGSKIFTDKYDKTINFEKDAINSK